VVSTQAVCTEGARERRLGSTAQKLVPGTRISAGLVQDQNLDRTIAGNRIAKNMS
jgi:hypothetical protein